jgi:anti-anti-sigma regulatory factor
MALFSRLPTRKPWLTKADGNGRAESGEARADGARGGRTTSSLGSVTGFGLIELSPTRRVIEVSHGDAALGAVLENAVLLFASGHADPARALLAEGIETDPETRQSAFAWLVLFDLLQRAGEREAFEQFALRYVVEHERSAPTWDDRAHPAAGPRPAAGGYASIVGKLTATSAGQLDTLRAAIVRNTTQARIDLAAITEFDDAGARTLADVLAEARRRKYPLRVQRPEHLRRSLDSAVGRGRDGGEGAWLLLLEILQWQGDRATFDDRAVDYAVTFEVSPPSWEPPAPAAAASVPAAPAAAASGAGGSKHDGRSLAWSGTVAGAHPEQIAELTEYADGRDVVPVDMAQVERIDFVAAGACYNAVKAIEERNKTVRIVGATPVIRAMLQLIGIPPGHFHHHA